MRIVSSKIEKEKDDKKKKWASNYLSKLKKEILEKCDDCILHSNKMVEKEDKEGELFFVKLIGDCYRYKTEILTDENEKDEKSKNEELFKQCNIKIHESLEHMEPVKSILLLLIIKFFLAPKYL